ncbi:phage portal protein, lambda family [Rhodomicrobium vannielii ATCC 17100]|uniref:Phage portal protein, lambda family n=1 Tax=Rhodomicrobium vannielii (strain ATCC 17100 / DSM 162 / LMG 4299 / NCIMB 10020 / ATH 3.1.1) TaxID=648757 RepID=E3I860_RHOVT|nr:phage portal protein [Rhodomicrobium vannielii]ADP71986.1 phage portal protein, lambda family [Rhodomicrobium vannielii ATCC 17100]
MGTLTRIRDWFATSKFQVRRFDAAGGGRRAHGFGSFGRTQTEVSGAAYQVRSRARYLYANNPWIRQGVDNWVGSLVGCGIVPAGAAEAVALFNQWADEADFDGRTDFFGSQSELARSLVVDGEAFLQVLVTEAGVRLRAIPAELVDESKTVESPNGGYCVSGVEFNSDGQRVAYWIRPSKPTAAFESYAPPVRIPASEILHIFKPLGAGQVRGMSWLSPITISANEFDGIVDALSVGIKIAAMHAGFLTDLNGAGEPFEGNLSDISLEPGTIRRLPQGFDIKFSSPEQASETAAFLNFQLRQLAAGLGLPDHMLSGDLSNANYSSLRAGLLPFRQRCEQVQYGVLVPQLLNPIWRAVMNFALLSGELKSVPHCEWLPPALMQVDPAKAAQADKLELEMGLTSRRKLVASRGWSVADLDSEIASDREREASLGLTFSEGSTDAQKAI